MMIAPYVAVGENSPRTCVRCCAWRLMKQWLSHFAIAAIILSAGAYRASAADVFPSRPIRIVVNTAAGGLTDVTTRVIAQYMGDYLKQSIVVDNRAGGDGQTRPARSDPSAHPE